MNLSAAAFVPQPKKPAGQSEGDIAASETPAEAEKRTHADSVTAEDFGGYENPYAITIDVEQERRKLKEQAAEEEAKKTYDIDFMMSFRDKCKSRPANMALLVLPHKKRLVKITKDEGPIDEAQEKFQR